MMPEVAANGQFSSPIDILVPVTCQGIRLPACSGTLRLPRGTPIAVHAGAYRRASTVVTEPPWTTQLRSVSLFEAPMPLSSTIAGSHE
jgi:hypothetical protein